MPRGSKGRREVRHSPLDGLFLLLVRAFGSVPECATGIASGAWLSGAEHQHALARGAVGSLGLGVWQPRVATVQGKLGVPSTALRPRRTAPAPSGTAISCGPLARLPGPQRPRGWEQDEGVPPPQPVSLSFYLETLPLDREFAGP